MVAKVQIKRTSSPNSPPAVLDPGELAVEMASPNPNLWVGVPTNVDATGRRLLNPAAATPVDAYTKVESDAKYVELTGDVMSGDLVIEKADALVGVRLPGNAGNASLVATTTGHTMVNLSKSTSGGVSKVVGYMGGVERWTLALGDETAESGGSIGSDFKVTRHADDGSLINNPLRIHRITGVTDVTGLNVYPTGAAGDTWASLSVIKVGTGAAAVTGGIGVAGASAARWMLCLGNSAPEGGGNTGSNFSLDRWLDNGGHGGSVMIADRATGRVTIPSSGLECANVGTYSPGYYNDGCGATMEWDTTNANAKMCCSSRDPDMVNFALQNNGAAVIFWRAGLVGSIGLSSTGTAYNTTSDINLKEDLKSFDAGNIIDDTKVYDFAWKDTGERSYGVMAQEAIEVYPQAITHEVFTDERPERWLVDYSKYVPVLLQEAKSNRETIRELRAEVATLRADIEAIQQHIGMATPKAGR